ncbi:methyltransferase [Bacillus sp. S3]|uniref:methyltransferase n=1 Tax=Bacillus sp. S3 TaxID=486398 RepID=UPI00118A3FDC|nr:methyltransferase [Bacillus sp. S3]QCJ44174.1 methyltransferase [Bacillus sp. S3]
MDKVLVEVFIPAANQTFDIFLPLKSKLHEVVLLVGNTLTELSQGYYTGTEQTVLCDRHTGEIFNINNTVEELGLKNGSKLMLL